MSEDQRVSHPSDEYVQEKKLRTINEKIAALNETIAELNQWKITLTGKVMPDPSGSFGLYLSFKKGDGNGFNYMVAPEMANAWAADPEGLVQSLVELAFDKLLHEHMRNEFTTIITKGLTNAAALNRNVK